MPLIGVTSPSHTELKVAMDGRLPNWYTVDELLQLSRTKGPTWSDWPYELIYAAVGEEREPSDRVSVTMMLACPRSAVIQKKEPYIGDIRSLYRAVRGTMIHRTLEKKVRPGAISEKHFLTELNGVELSCIVDLITAEGDLYDYKVVEKIPNWGYPYRSQTLQLMFNAFIVRHAKRMKDYDTGEEWTGEALKQLVPDIRSTSIVYLGPDGPKTMPIKKKQEVTTPRGRIVERLMPYVWNDVEVLEDHKQNGRMEARLESRVAAMRLALDSYPDFPPQLAEAWGGDPADGWKCPGKPWCSLPDCEAKRFPNGLVWDKQEEDDE